ncbi:MAG: FN3 associated domain-containing protein [Phycisphaerae bacterium]|nr:FN3 associated domain-containing protein [Phycisphaerae bacterium]
MRISLFSLVIVGVLAGFAVAGLCPQGDISGDCTVDWWDIQILSEQWLDNGDCEDVVCADIDGLNGINLVDFSILANSWFDRGIALSINEFMASNNSDSDINDLYGDYDDWIEIYNFGDTPIDLAGMYLSDKPDNPTKWQFPSGYSSQTTVPAHGFVVIWADEEPNQGPLHAEVKLSADGEDILLSDANETLIDSITFGSQTTNISYERYPDAGDNWQFSTTPTPGAHNNPGYTGEVNEVEFSHIRGFYDTPFNVTMSCTTPNATIYYTTNGSNPVSGEVNSPQSIRYTAPVTISSTKCLRASATKTGWRPSPSMSHTYIFGASATVRAMPLVSLVGDYGQTFFEPDGVMAIVGGYYSGGVWQSGGVGTYNNPLQRGLEKPVSLEIIDPQADANYQINCGIRVHGSDYTRPRYTRGSDWSTCWSGWPNWNSNKFSFNLYFRSDYGSNNRLEYPFFAWTPEVVRFGSIVLRAGHNDACTPFVKDEWMRRLFKEMGGVQETGTFANLYINGQFKAYYNVTGRADDEFYQEWYNTDNDFDVITQSGVRDGDSAAFYSLINYANTHDLSNTTYYSYVADRLDIPMFVDYLVLQIYSGNFDWPGNNWTAHCEKADGSKFRFTIWDAEGIETWTLENHMDMNAFEDFPNWTSPTGLNHLPWDPTSQIYRALKANSYFRQLFADRIHKHFRNGGILTKNHLLAKWWEVFGEVSPVLPETSNYPVRFIPDNLIPNRETPILAVFEKQGLFNLAQSAPVFYVNGVYKFGGDVSSSDTFTITDPCSVDAIYYTLDGSDPRDQFTGAISPGAIHYTGSFTLNQNAVLKARTYKTAGAKWSALNEAAYTVVPSP